VFAFLIAVKAVKPEQASEAALSRSIPSTLTRNFTFGTRTYSAYPPSWNSPIERGVSHRLSFPTLQAGQKPHPIQG